MPRTKKPNGYWDYEHCKEEALKYSSRRDFSKGSQFAYKIACENKWIDDWFVSATGKKWTEKTCREESQKYQCRSDFQKGSSGAYAASKKNGWLNSFSWLIDGRIKLLQSRVDSVYVYEFTELNYAYIGRTLMRQQKTRDKQHLWRDDTVARFVQEHDVSLPPMKILEDHLTLEEGIQKEGEYVNIYIQNGWNVLNKAKTGAIGSIGKGKWTKKACKEEAQKYQSFSQFRKNGGRAYQVAFMNNWLEDYYWLVRTQKPKGYWTYERCFTEAQNYNTLSELLKNNEAVYRISVRNGWLKDFTWLERQLKPKSYWTRESCLNEAKKYRSKKELERNNGTVYAIARRNGWLVDYVWFEKNVKAIIPGQLEISFDDSSESFELEIEIDE